MLCLLEYMLPLVNLYEEIGRDSPEEELVIVEKNVTIEMGSLSPYWKFQDFIMFQQGHIYHIYKIYIHITYMIYGVYII